jgi:hypothetical protein
MADPKSQNPNTRDAVLSRMLKTPPQPFTPKAKKKPSRGKAEVKSGGKA